ncbi:MAG: phasin family protein [Candidatus Andeanibacterium colombiense]|uniref:Phasin family protein n=1 Tax=Candidatus Andeanibacterium colombiense TaxID=3121345 RepID=A0AAJ6BQY8_9SPHN|nr:MAG: phasin family protein [Sphingomonadaceae bacterium]
MADETEKELEAAAKAYAAAAEAVPAKLEPVKVEPAKPAAKASAAQTTPPAEPVASAPLKAEIVKRAPVKKPAPAKAKPKAAKTVPTPEIFPKTKPVAKPLAAKPVKAATTPKALPEATQAPKSLIALKERIMAKTPDFTQTVTDAVADLQTKAKTAYEKSTALAGEATEFAKGNVEAMVESGKIFTEGFKSIGKSYAEEAKSAYETATADFKEIAAIKSPTELFQLQGKLARRNFDAMMAFGSKSSEALVKLASEGFAPLSSRASLAAEKLSKAA